MNVEQNEIEIKKEDQEKINMFSRLHRKKQEIVLQIKTLEDKKLALEDCSEELELCDDEDINYNFADCYLKLPSEKALEIVTKELEEATQEIKDKVQIKKVLLKQLDGLKKELYTKFGNNIQLEEQLIQ